MNLQDTLKIDEGVKNTIYLCPAGYNTIGVGHNLDANSISTAAVEQILDDDIAIIRAELASCKYSTTYLMLDEPRRIAIENMAFNMGVPRLMGFNKMWAALSLSDYKAASLEAIDSRWYKQVGDRGDRIAITLRDGHLRAYEVLNG